MDLKLPAPCVVVLIGPSRAGKTTWAHKHFADNEVVSSDALRAMVGTGEDDQVASKAAFSLLDQIVASRLARKLTTIIDTTGLHSETRKKWVQQAADAELPIYAVLFKSTFEEADNLNQRRTRPIPRVSSVNSFPTSTRSLLRYPTKVSTASTTDSRCVWSPPGPGVHRTRGHCGIVSKSHLRLLLSRFDWATHNLGEEIVGLAKTR